MSTKDLHAVLQRVVDRNESQKLTDIGNLRAELFELGYSVVTTEWLHAVFDQMTAVNIERIAREKAE